MTVTDTREIFMSHKSGEWIARAKLDIRARTAARACSASPENTSSLPAPLPVSFAKLVFIQLTWAPGTYKRAIFALPIHRRRLAALSTPPAPAMPARRALTAARARSASPESTRSWQDPIHAMTAKSAHIPLPWAQQRQAHAFTVTSANIPAPRARQACAWAALPDHRHV